jgi:hypothetical protein
MAVLNSYFKLTTTTFLSRDIPVTRQIEENVSNILFVRQG